ncbi:MAG: phenylalanine--tRNA ligase subunit beta [Gammaproteobacteria bacterium]
MRKSRVELLLGEQFSTEQIGGMLERLGMHILHQEDDSWTMVAPSWRFDIAIEADLIEEIARIYGYNNLPERTPAARLPLGNVPENRLSQRALPDRLVGQGYREIISYSFIDPRVHQACFGDAVFIEVENPISADMSVMRTSLLPGLLTTVEYNLKRQHPNLALFEDGLVFVPTSDPVSPENLDQVARIAGVLVGTRETESWANRKDKVDFYDVKRDVELLLGEKQLDYVEFEPCTDNSLFHPGQCACISKNGTPIGYAGTIHPAVQKKLDIDRPVYAFELDLDKLQEITAPSFKPLGRFPEIRRDIAIVVDRKISGESLVQTAKKSAGETLSDARIFDIYVGQGIDSNKKSVAIGLTFRDYSRTLNDEEVTALVEGILRSLAAEYGAVQR